jgi:hypothetical protein
MRFDAQRSHAPCDRLRRADVRDGWVEDAVFRNEAKPSDRLWTRWRVRSLPYD